VEITAGRYQVNVLKPGIGSSECADGILNCSVIDLEASIALASDKGYYGHVHSES
jgi:hypothetical protein